MKRIYTISAYTENHPGVLHRLTSVFTRRKVNIDSLTVSETEREEISRFTIVVQCDPLMVRKIARAIDRIIEVVDVFVSQNEHLLFKEIAFIRVAAESPDKRNEIEEFAHRHGGVIGYASDDSIIVETMGSEDEIKSLYLLLERFGIKEFIRSGRIAVRKQPRKKGEMFVD